MKQIRISYLFFALPLVFFVLSGSPNLTGPRIGTTLGIVAILFILVSYLNHRTKKKSVHQFKIADALFSGAVIGCMFMGKAVNYEFAFLIPAWALLMLIKPRNIVKRLFVGVFQGLILFFLIYFGINQYDFTNLLNERVILMGSVFVLQYLFITFLFRRPNEVSIANRIREIKWAYIISLLSLGLFSWGLYDFKYMIYIVVLAAPALFLIYKLSRKGVVESQSISINRFTILSILGLTVFNLYLFLDTTQVLQAVMGGY